jgi:hypothetical protein
MSTKDNITSAQAANGGAAIVTVEPPVTPTVTHYQQLASAVMVAIDDLATIMPPLEQRHFSTADFARTHVNISNDFLATVISAVEQTPDLQMVNKLDVTLGRDTLQFLEAFRPVFDKVTAFRKNLGFTMMARKADLVASTLQIYDIAKGMSRDANSAALSSHVENMKRDLGRARPSRKAKAAPVAPPPAKAE